MTQIKTVSPEPDVSIFIGRSLWSFQVGAGNVVLNFGLPVRPGESIPQVSISIEGPYRVRVIDSQSIARGDTPKSSVALTELLLKNVTHASITEDRDFEVVFEDATTLLVMRDNDGFESFQIHVPGGFYVFS